ncbi:hypothetical protein OG474_14345 [Kribbella sp. NBC_01505]|uniref:hypothetical protein n=1 Tax=Kribbella sp. NBC_01505 TaxID=2903580 RepID=UPI0038675A96
MNQQHEDYAGLLKALKEAPDEPTESISIDRAIHDGRRTIHRRRVLGGLAVVGIVGAASSVRPLLNAFQEPPVAGLPPFEPFEVWGREFDAGTAGGFQPYQYVTGRRFQIIALTRTDRSGPSDAAAAVTLYAPGLKPSAGPSIRPLDPIEGRPVYVVSENKAAVTITWQYADDAWGTVVVFTDHADRLQRARHVAESIHRRKAPAMLTVPFTVPRRLFTADSEVVMVRVPYVRADKYVTYEVTVADFTPTDPSQVSGLPAAGVEKPLPDEKPNTKIDGRQAQVDGGLNATIFGLGSGFAAHAAADKPLDAKAIAAAVQLISDPSKPGQGTDKPLR